MLHKQGQALSEIVLTPPFSVRLVGWCAALLIVSCIGASLLVRYSKKVQIRGWLMPDAGLVQVYSPQNGTVIQVGATEGSHVRKGDLLFVISSEKSSAEFGSMGPLTRANLAVMVESLAHEDATLLKMNTQAISEKERTTREYKLNLDKAQKDLKLTEDRMDLSRKELDRFQVLLNEHLIPEAEYDHRREEFLQRQSDLVAAERKISTTTDEYNKALSEFEYAVKERTLRRLDIERQLATLRGQKYDHALQTSLEIRASADAVVSSQLASAGRGVDTSSPMAVLLPDSSAVHFHGFVEGKAGGLIKAGQRLALRFESGSAEPVFAHVAWISPAPVPEGAIRSKYGVSETGPAYEVIADQPMDAMAIGDRYVRRPGLELSADVFVQEKSVARWLMDLLLDRGGEAGK